MFTRTVQAGGGGEEDFSAFFDRMTFKENKFFNSASLDLSSYVGKKILIILVASGTTSLADTINRVTESTVSIGVEILKNTTPASASTSSPWCANSMYLLDIASTATSPTLTTVGRYGTYAQIFEVD